MAEIPGTKPATDVHWADGGTTGGVTEPAESRKLNGFDNLVKPVHSELNWNNREISEHLRWAVGNNSLTPNAGAIIRRFENISEGIAATLSLETFMVEHGFSDLRAAAKEWNKVADSAGVVNDIETDGEYVIVADDDSVTVLDPIDGSVVWGPTTYGGGTVRAVAIDDEHAWVGTDAQGGAAELYKVNRLTGAVIQSLELGVGVVDLSTNGDRIAWATTAGIEVRDTADISISTGSTATHGATVRAVALDSTRVYLAGDSDGTDADEIVRAYIGLGGVLSQDWDFIDSPGDRGRSIVSDGDKLYVCGDITANNIHALIGSTGAIDWTAPTTATPLNIAVDQTRVYTVDGSATSILQQVSKFDGSRVPFNPDVFVNTGVGTGLAVDGMAAYTSVLAGTPAVDLAIRKIDCARGSQLFRRTTTTVPAGFVPPFAHLAIPLGRPY